MKDDLRHWKRSARAGFILTGEYKPVCAIVFGLPDSWPKRAFIADMDRRFREAHHCQRIHDTYWIGWLLRGPVSR